MASAPARGSNLEDLLGKTTQRVFQNLQLAGSRAVWLCPCKNTAMSWWESILLSLWTGLVAWGLEGGTGHKAVPAPGSALRSVGSTMAQPCSGLHGDSWESAWRPSRWCQAGKAPQKQELGSQSETSQRQLAHRARRRGEP